MRRILHLSDLHFGKIHPPALHSLQRFIEEQEKTLHLIIVTGDWTQRARHNQFAEAEAFIKRLNLPVLGVPGNHDIPLYDFVARFLRPFKRYQEYIGRWVKISFADEEMMVWGVTTPTRRRAVEGRLSSQENIRAQEFFTDTGERWRIIAGHHPEVLNELDALSPHVILSGHLHQRIVEFRENKTLIIGAGSGTSTRIRGESNGFNLIELDTDQVRVRSHLLSEEGFIEADKIESFRF